MTTLKPKEVIEQILEACGSDGNDAAPILVGLRLAGYVIVPREPTPAMIEAGLREIDGNETQLAIAYTSMLLEAVKS